MKTSRSSKHIAQRRHTSANLPAVRTRGCHRAAAPSCPAGLLLALALPVGAATEAHDLTLPISATLGYERISLPQGERMGLVGGSLLFNAGGWWLGPAIYGAAEGRRGGLFVFGAEVQRRWALGPGELVAGLHAGGGGGANAPVGDGLMLRPALSYLVGGPGLRVGLSASALHFPGSDIRSRQLGLVLAWDGSFPVESAAAHGQAARSAERSGLGADQLSGTITRYDVRRGQAATNRVDLVGARLERSAATAGPGGRWSWGLGTAAAANGGAAGYMEILATAGWDTTLDARGALRLGARAGVGLAGGGAVDTGGGIIGRLQAGPSLRIGPGLYAGLEVGRLWAANTPLRATVMQAWISTALEPEVGTNGRSEGVLARTEWTAALQHNVDTPRLLGPARNMDTVGLKLTRYVSEHVYVTGQWHAAYAGGAGAYGRGLVGAGWATTARPTAWRAGAELLAGASGGGGVAGGAAVQGLAWAGYSLSPSLELRLGAGAARSRQGGATAPIAELSLTWAYAQLAR